MRPRTLLSLLAFAGALGVWLAHVSEPGSAPVGCASGCAAAPERGARPIRLLTLNLHHDFPRFGALERRLDLLIAQARAMEVDVLALQEVPWTPFLGNAATYLAEGLEMNHLYARANGNRRAILFEEGVAIVSRFPLEEASITVLEPRIGWFEQRVVLRARALTPRGALPLAVTHLTRRGSGANPLQMASLRALLAESAGEPFVIAGDLNAEPSSAQVIALAREWRDAFYEQQPEADGATCCSRDLRGPDRAMRGRVDYVLVRRASEPGIAILGAEVVLDTPFRVEDGWLRISDHAGVAVQLDLRPDGT